MQNALGDRAQPNARQAAAAVGAHGNQIRTDFMLNLEDRRDRFSLDDQRVTRHRWRKVFLSELADVSFC
jgi:hypothetical protein